MTYPARILILALFVILAATVNGYIVNFFLMIFEAFYALPRVSLYAPGANLITNLIASNAQTDQGAQAILAVSRNYMLIQATIFMSLVILSSVFAFLTRNPKGIFTVISCSLFVVVPGIAILKIWAPMYFSYRAPDVHWAFLDFQSTVLQIGLSLTFYAALFFVGTLIIADEEPRAAGSA